METLVLERTTPIDLLFSFMGARGQVRIVKESNRATIAPVLDPDDYETETDYINAIPGMREKIIEGLNTPLSECVDVPEDWIDRDV